MSLLYIQNSKTGSTFLGAWCKKNNIKITYNMCHLSDPDNNFNYKNYYCFSSVRNPYQRAYSMYVHNRRVTEWLPYLKEVKNFIDYLNFDFSIFYNDKTDHDKLHFGIHNQGLYSYLKEKITLIQHFIKIENFEKDVDYLNKKFNLVKQKNVIYNIGTYDKNEIKNLYKSKEIRDLVYNKYKEDFSFFGYDREDYL
jgi:dermatan 4-sulfotransferase 1